MIYYLLAGILGITFCFLGLANEAKKDFKAAGHPFVLKNFFRDEQLSVYMHIVAVLGAAITVNEWGPKAGMLKDFITCIFFLVGIIGPFIVSLIASGSKKYARTVIDLKTNIVDNEIGKTTTITEIKEKASEMGKDISTPVK